MHARAGVRLPVDEALHAATSARNRKCRGASGDVTSCTNESPELHEVLFTSELNRGAFTAQPAVVGDGILAASLAMDCLFVLGSVGD